MQDSKILDPRVNAIREAFIKQLMMQVQAAHRLPPDHPEMQIHAQRVATIVNIAFSTVDLFIGAGLLVPGPEWPKDKSDD